MWGKTTSSDSRIDSQPLAVAQMENICHFQRVPQTLGGAVPQPGSDAEAVTPPVSSHLCLQSRLGSVPLSRAFVRAPAAPSAQVQHKVRLCLTSSAAWS